jgi:hypothetical protein
MKLPIKDSRGEQVLLSLHSSGPCALNQVARRHADFRMMPCQIVSIYERLVATGCAESIDGVYSIRLQAQRYLDQLTEPKPLPGTVSGPAYRPTPKPLDLSRTRMVMTREGAFDYQNVPSLVGSSRIAFKSARVEDADGVA